VTDLDTLSALKIQIDGLLAVTIERAGQLIGVSTRTMYRRRHKFEICRRNRHLYVSVQSIIKFVAEETYRGNKHYDLTRSFKSPMGRKAG